MAHLNATRKGWQNEHLGLFILSKFAFCASPVTVSDDLGSDFFCCLFEIRKLRGIEVVLPLSSFAIQIKSTATPFDITDKIRYLSDLEVPFFVGVVERSTLALHIYSGEFLPLMFSEKGLPRALRIKLVNRSVSISRYHEPFGPKKYRILFPRVARIGARSHKTDIKRVVKVLGALCRRVQSNIATRRTEEHVYSIPGRYPTYIMAGPGSVKVFRDNFYKRLAEVFYNFDWQKRHQRRRLDLGEVQIYDEFIRKLKKYGVKMPGLVRKRHCALMRALRGRRQVAAAVRRLTRTKTM
jgi:hypothetical protein